MHTSDDALKHFIERIMRIDPARLNMFGSGYPSFQGSTGILGGSGSAAEVIGKLRRAVAAFAQAYRQPEPQRSHLLKAAEYVEGQLQVLQTLSIITASDADGLLHELHQLIDYRTPVAP
jgi:hypothetical protein